MVPDSEAQQKLVNVVLNLIMDKDKLLHMQEQLRPLGIKDADQRVAVEIMKWINA
jgi:UDP-N-acetylglucosamine:LPS N-acetylglucosamine transferase